MAYKIKTATLTDVKMITDWETQEGWNPGRSDALPFYMNDPTGFFIGELEGKPIASISNVRYSKDYSFVGIYMVKPQYRGLGYGYQIWQHAMAYGSQQMVALDSVMEQQSNYEKSGFKYAYNNTRYEGRIIEENISQKSLTPAENVSLVDILKYSEPFFVSPRNTFLPFWLFATKAKTLVYLVNNKIQGYGTIREAVSGFKIGPLFADNHEIAEQLLLGLSQYANGRSIYIDIFDVNDKAIALAERYGMEKNFETARMYTTEYPPDISTEKTYGNTSLETG